MIPADMLIQHDPANGVYGDCFRACVASILELPAQDVPHFFHDGPAPNGVEDSGPGWARLQEFLGQQTPPLAALGISMHDEEALETYTSFLREHIDAHYLMGGLTDRGTAHIVVCHRGRMVHDPHPSRKGLAPGLPKDLIFILRR